MARKRRVLPSAPARNDVYVLMLLVTLVVTGIGTALLALECNEYGWDSQPTAGPAITIPEVPVGRPAPVDPTDAGAVSARPAELPAKPLLADTFPVGTSAETPGLR